MKLFSLKKLSALAAVISVCAVSAFAGSARAATVDQQSCSINGISGSGVAVFQGSDLILTSCHTGSLSTGQPLVIHSGDCVTVGDKLNVCAGNRQ